MAQMSLVCEELSKSYGGVHALRGVSLEVEEASVVGLVGPNGAGKTTLIDIVTGVQKPDSGHVYIDNKRISGGPVTRVQAGLARTFQHPQLGMDLTVRENLLLGLAGMKLTSFGKVALELMRGMIKPYDRNDNAAVQEVAEMVELGDLDKLAGDLTLGEHRVIEVARAFLSKPKVLLMDEPFAGSDEAVQERIALVIRLLTEAGSSVVLVDHNVDLVAKSSDNMFLLNFGEVAYQGRPQNVLESAEMKRVYFGEE